MPYKGTFIFSHSENGWSESWYKNAGSIADAGQDFIALGAIRSMALGRTSSLDFIRVTDTTLPGASLILSVNYPQPPEAQANMTDTPWNGVLVRVQDVNRIYRRSLILRGVYDSMITYSVATGLPSPSGLLIDAITQYRAALRAGLYLLRVIDRTPGVAPRRPITNITFAAMTGTYTVTAPNHGFVAQDFVRVGATSGLGLELYNRGKTVRLRGPNRVVAVPDANTFTVILPGTTPDPLTVTKYGYAVKQVINYFPVFNMNFVKFAKKSTGGAFFKERGRARGRR